MSSATATIMTTATILQEFNRANHTRNPGNACERLATERLAFASRWLALATVLDEPKVYLVKALRWTGLRVKEYRTAPNVNV